MTSGSLAVPAIKAFCVGQAKSIPPSRRLILKTHELGRSHNRVADFLEISVDSLATRNGHVNRATGTDRVGPMIDRAYAAERVVSLCAENTAHYFPNVDGFDDACKLWEA